MRYAKIENGVVVSVIKAMAPFEQHDTSVPKNLAVGPGTPFANGIFDAPEIPDPENQTTPQPLTRVQFVRLCMSAGGMTEQMLVDSRADANLAAMWMLMEMATHLEKDDPEIVPGLTALETLGYLPNGADAVLNAWPEV